MVHSFVHSYNLARPLDSWKVAKPGLVSNVGPKLWLFERLQSPSIPAPADPGEQCFVGSQIHRELNHGSFGSGPGDGMAIISNLFSEKSEPCEQTSSHTVSGERKAWNVRSYFPKISSEP